MYNTPLSLLYPTVALQMFVPLLGGSGQLWRKDNSTRNPSLRGVAFVGSAMYNKLLLLFKNFAAVLVHVGRTAPVAGDSWRWIGTQPRGPHKRPMPFLGGMVFISAAVSSA